MAYTEYFNMHHYIKFVIYTYVNVITLQVLKTCTCTVSRVHNKESLPRFVY